MVKAGSVLRRIVLVHGAAHGAWCWESLVPLLEAKGYDVDTLDLPGLGEDRTPPRAVTLQSYIDRVVETVSAKPEPALLVGHSMGGAPISGAGEAIPERIGKLVYLAAFLPKDGESMLKMIEVVTQFQEPSVVGASTSSDGAHVFPPDAARQMFYNICAPDIADRAVARLRPQAEGPLADPLQLSPGRWGAIPKTYIVCLRDRALPTPAQHWSCERAPEVKKRVMDTDHSPFYSDPEGLANILDEEARA